MLPTPRWIILLLTSDAKFMEIHWSKKSCNLCRTNLCVRAVARYNVLLKFLFNPVFSFSVSFSDCILFGNVTLEFRMYSVISLHALIITAICTSNSVTYYNFPLWKSTLLIFPLLNYRSFHKRLFDPFHRSSFFPKIVHYAYFLSK